MSLTPHFIASLLSQQKNHLYSILDPNFKPPRVQVTSLHSNPNMMRFQKMLEGTGIDVPVVSLQGIQWMTVSDGNYSISASLNPDLEHLVKSGFVKKNTVLEINGYNIGDNKDEAFAGRNLLLYVGAITCIFPNFPEQIGEPKDIFDALKDGPLQYSNIPTHPILHLTPRAFDGIFAANPKSRQVFTVRTPLIVQVTTIGKLNRDIWFVQLYDGGRECMAALWTMIDLEKVGITGHLRNNLLGVMTDDHGALQVGDIISFSQLCMLGEANAMMMCLFNINIEHRV